MNYYPKQFVPNIGPTNAKILFIGESPGEDETIKGEPFVGVAGNKLMEVLDRHGITREEVGLANLFGYRPHGNKISAVLNETEFKESVRLLHEYILCTKPVVICPLGTFPTAFMTGKYGISKWRGSIIPYINDPTIKVIPTYHPSYVLRNRKHYPTFSRDIKRVVTDSTTRDFNYPVRRSIVNPRGLELEEWTQKLCAAEYLATDIETVKNSTHILCVGFAPDTSVSVCISTEYEEGKRAIQRILDSDADKIFQFGTFDFRQLRINGYSINPGKKSKGLDRIYYWDTLLAQHTIAPELPRSLEYLTSIHTRLPYYKTEGRGSKSKSQEETEAAIPNDVKSWSEKADKQTLYEYNNKDTYATFAIFLAQLEIADSMAEFYHTFDFEMSSLEVTDDMGSDGMLIDDDRRDLMERALIAKWEQKQYAINVACGVKVNVRSPLLKKVLYEKEYLGLPTRRNRDGGITTDEDAIVSLIAFCKGKMEEGVKESTKQVWELKLEILKAILEVRGIRQLLSNYIRTTIGKKVRRVGSDGRIRSTYKVGGTETGRWSGSKYCDGSGFNPQTLPRDPIEISQSEYDRLLELQKLDKDRYTKEMMDELMEEKEDSDNEDDTELEEAA